MKCIRERCRGDIIDSVVLEASLQEPSENHLQVAPIRSGDTVIIMNEGFLTVYAGIMYTLGE